MKKTAKNFSELADLVGRNRSTVTRWVKKTDWPTRRVGPWAGPEISVIRKWATTLQRDRRKDSQANTATADQIRQARKIKLIAEVGLIAVMNSVAAGEFLVMATLKQAVSKSIIVARQTVYSLISTITAQPDQAELILSDRLPDIHKNLSDQFSNSIAEARATPLAINPEIILGIRRPDVVKALQAIPAEAIPRLEITPASDARIKKLAGQVERIKIETVKRVQGLESTSVVREYLDGQLVRVRMLFEKIKRELPGMVEKITGGAEVDAAVQGYFDLVFTEFSRHATG